MPTSLPSGPTFEEGVDPPLDVLADRVQTVLEDASPEAERIARVSVPVGSDVDPIQWIRAQEAADVVYWSSRTPGASTSGRASGPDREAVALAAVGSADVITSTRTPLDYERLRRRLRDRFAAADGPIRYVGGLRFDAPQPASARRPDDLWRPFGTCRFVLPRFELVGRAGERELACNLVLPRDAARAGALRDRIRALTFPSPSTPNGALPRPSRRTDRPDREGWTRMIRWALSAIDDGRLDKVVFARRVSLALDSGADPLRVLRHLKATTPGCFHFALRPPSGPAFIGASPERLFRRDGARVLSEAVAGTRERGDTEEADAALREELLTSAKERREHAFVQRAIERALSTVCDSVEGAERPSELALARGRHLHAPIEGTLRADASTVDLLEALHPTPAVGGVPTDAALGAIREQEPFDRGWYAGPVGWIGPEAAEFAVAIRSGLLGPSSLSLFSGAGIVDGSVPDREWAEIEQKIGDFAAVLGLLGQTDGARR